MLLLRINSVVSPYKGTFAWSRYGANTEQIRHKPATRSANGLYRNNHLWNNKKQAI